MERLWLGSSCGGDGETQCTREDGLIIILQPTRSICCSLESRSLLSILNTTIGLKSTLVRYMDHFKQASPRARPSQHCPHTCYESVFPAAAAVLSSLPSSGALGSLSITIVTGPSFTSCTSILAPNFPSNILSS